MLQEPGPPVGRHKVSELLDPLGYSLPANRKTREGRAHVDRAAQCEPINAPVNPPQPRGQPVLSVDTQQQARSGAFKKGGRAWQPRGKPVEVRPHDCRERSLGQVNP